MEPKTNKTFNRKKQLFLLLFTIVIILFGFWFSINNIYKFTKGYFADKTYTQSSQVTEPTKKTEKDTEEELYSERPKKGEEIGELYIPKLNATLPIYHGTDEDELERGVGHFAESVLPGENDNSVLSGHRDTVFRKLGEVGEGDWLIVRTSAGEFKYKVNKVRIVDDDDRTVIVPKPRATLTVSTCYPFEYIGSAPERYILVAYLASKTVS
ncbi:class D sortase [Metabacillus sp. Hm71]|uniref:class D sortase n=1 Tax=Metabacillus sp. Hm71 TaxID=3450743 RepID=UPI003F4212A6